MVFYRLAAGFVFGVTFPMVCNESVYMLLATSFLRPHLKYRMNLATLDKDAALPSQFLDEYLADMFKSTVFFFFAAPMMMYKVYVKGEDFSQGNPQLQ